MKANDGSGNIPDRDEWETPKELFDKLYNQYKFDFDCCANDDNKKTKFRSDDFICWNDNSYFNKYICWMNPPFSKAKEMFEHYFEVVYSGVAIYRCDNMETKIWQDIILPNCDWIFIPKGRIVYEGMNGSGSRFPSALIGLNIDMPKGIDGYYIEMNDSMKVES